MATQSTTQFSFSETYLERLERTIKKLVLLYPKNVKFETIDYGVKIQNHSLSYYDAFSKATIPGAHIPKETRLDLLISLFGLITGKFKTSS